MYLVKLICCLLLMTGIQASQLIIRPSADVPTGTSTLTLSCLPTFADDFVTWEYIKIQKHNRTKLIAHIPTDEYRLAPGFSRPNYKASSRGFGNRPLDSYLEVDIHYPDSRHAGDYNCIVGGYKRNEQVLTEERCDKDVTFIGVVTTGLYVTPSPHIQEGDSSITIRCSSTYESEYTKIFSLYILKNKTTEVAHINRFGHVSGPEFGSPKYTVTSQFDEDAPWNSYIQVTINNPSCTDAAMYECATSGDTRVGPNSYRYNQTITIGGDMSMAARPNRRFLNINETLKLECSGEVGNPPQNISWQWKEQDSNNWVRYPTPSDIKDGDVIPPNSTRCNYFTSSSLRYRVEEGDNGKDFRCIVNGVDVLSVKTTIKLATVDATRIHISPSARPPVGASYLTINCSPIERSGYTSLEYIEITRRSAGSPVRIAFITSSGITRGPGLTQPKYNISGEFIGITESYLQIDVINPDCTEEAEYQCVTVGNSGSETQRLQATATVAFERTLKITTNPNRRFSNINETRDIECNGEVGNPPQNITWEWKSPGGDWVDYPNIENVNNSIVEALPSTGCYYFTRSILKHKVVAGDNGRQFRCTVGGPEPANRITTIYLANMDAARVQVSPGDNLSAGAANLTIQCSAIETSDFTSLNYIKILKHNPQAPAFPTTLASISSAGATLGSGITQPKYNISGEFKGITESYVRLVITNPDCTDAGQYICSTNGVTDDGDQTLQANSVVNVESEVRDLDIKKEPDIPIYPRGTKITIECSGYTGTHQHQWSWVYSKYYTLVNYVSNSNVPPLSDQHDVMNQTSYNPQCGNFTRTSLTYVIRDDDNALRFTCKLGQSTSYSKSISICIGAEPEKLKMLTTPVGRRVYDINSTVAMTCTGRVGVPLKNWTWQWRDDPLNKTWLPYQYPDTISTMYNSDKFGCDSFTSSTLIHTMTDRGIEFKCILGGSEAYSFTNTLYPTVISPGQLQIQNIPEADTKIRKLKLRCSPQKDAGYTRLDSIWIKRTPYQIWKIDKSGLSSFYDSGVAVTNSFDPAAPLNSYLAIEYIPSRGGHHQFSCSTTGITEDKLQRLEDSKNATVNILPTHIDISKKPNTPFSTVGDLLQFKCEGDIGNPPQNLSWQYRPNSNSPWRTYIRSEDISTAIVRPHLEGYQYSTRSFLSYTVKDDDDGKQFRCTAAGLETHNQYITIHLSKDDAVDIYISPPVFKPNKTGTLTVECSLNTSYPNHLIQLVEIQKLPVNKIDSRVLLGTVSNGTAVLGPDISPNKYNLQMISTRLGVFTKAVLIIKQPNCSDTGQYRCIVKVSNDAGIKNLQGDFHLKATGTPSMVVRQPEQSVYPSSTRIRLECSGIVSNWSWQWRLPGDRLTWQPFPYSENITVERVLDPLGYGTTSISQGETRTVLTYLTKARESGVQFRCTFSEPGITFTARIPFTTVCIEQEPSNLKMEVIRDIDDRPSSIVCSGVTSIKSEKWRWEWRSPPSYPNWSVYHNISESSRTLNNDNCSYSTRSTLNLITDTVSELRCIFGNSDKHSLNLRFNETDRVRAKVKECSSCECKLKKVYSASSIHCQDLSRLYRDCLSIEDMKKLGCHASAGVGILTYSSILLHLGSFVVIINHSF